MGHKTGPKPHVKVLGDAGYGRIDHPGTPDKRMNVDFAGQTYQQWFRKQRSGDEFHDFLSYDQWDNGFMDERQNGKWRFLTSIKKIDFKSDN